MWWWRKVRRATIPDKLREQFELFGKDVLAHALAVGPYTMAQGELLVGLLRDHHGDIMDWLREKRDDDALHADRVETVEWAILIAVIIGVAADLAIVAHEIGWLHN